MAEKKNTEKKEIKEESAEKEEPKQADSSLPKEQKDSSLPKKDKLDEALTKDIQKETKVFTIPLRKAFRKTENKRPDYASKIVKDFLKRHTKNQDVKLGKNLSEKLHSMPRKVRVSVFNEDGITKAELMGHVYKEFKAIPKTEKPGMREKLMGRLGPKAAKKQQEEEAVKEQRKPEAPKKEEKHQILEE